MATITDENEPKTARASGSSARWRPYNSVRFICDCGRKQTFPTSPAGGITASRDYTLPDGTRKTVSATDKAVHCICGLTTRKERCSFNGR